MRAKYVLNEVLVGLWRNVTMTIAMIITMVVSLAILGASVLGFMQVGQMKEFYYGEIQVAVFMADDATPEQRTSLDQSLRSNPLVAGHEFESHQDALKKFQKMWEDNPNFVKAIKAEDLPESFRVQLKDPEQYKVFADSLSGVPGIADIVDQQQLLEKVFQIFGDLQQVGLFVAGFMALAALLLVGNTIQVAAYSKRREVAVMKLVGASNWFIQAPFVLEAVVAGVIGAIIGWGLLFAGKLLVIDGSLKALTTVLTPVPNDNVLLMLPLMIGVGAVASAATAWVTLRFYLRV
jgi:cell division transport system permease protein